MSQAKWCDYGDHAFSAREPGTQTLSITQMDEDVYGRPQAVKIENDLCQACAVKLGLINAGKQMKRQLQKGKTDDAV